jgi:hypothetical protein
VILHRDPARKADAAVVGRHHRHVLGVPGHATSEIAQLGAGAPRAIGVHQPRQGRSRDQPAWELGDDLVAKLLTVDHLDAVVGLEHQTAVVKEDQLSGGHLAVLAGHHQLVSQRSLQ